MIYYQDYRDYQDFHTLIQPVVYANILVELKLGNPGKPGKAGSTYTHPTIISQEHPATEGPKP